MTQWKQGLEVCHVDLPELGIGSVLVAMPNGAIYVKWSSVPEAPREHTPDELEPVGNIAQRLTPDRLGGASFEPFLLRLLARWFEARHALTGELSNQPFQMLPHQVVVANRVINSAADGRRWLIADDVGLGKTIEAGMIMEVLRKRKLGYFRCLVVAPAGLRQQWKEEMERRFRRNFRLFDTRAPNELEDSHQLIASVDTLKRKKLHTAIESVTPWDLVIFDEAHHLATETNVHRYDLARRLHDSGRAHNTLFLTATPHSGNVGHFWNMLRLLREDLFPTEDSVSGAKLNEVMIRNRKSEVTDVDGQPIFRGISPAQIIKAPPSDSEVAFFEELIEFVREGYGVATRLKKGKNHSGGNAVGFLMAMFRKLASSSRAAISSALYNRRQALQEADELERESGEDEDERYQGEVEERKMKTAGLSRKGKRVLSPIQNELESIERLIALLAEIDHPDTKMSYFVEELQKLPSDEKGLIFTEYRGTQAALLVALREVFGEDAVGEVHGSMKMAERQAQVAAFNNDPKRRFLVSTEAGGEGLNMQRACRILFNYDLPWNPVRLQQRIGRVYRYGQQRPVQVYHVRRDSESAAFADDKIEEYLRAKIQEISNAIAQVQGGRPEDLENDVLGQVAASMSLDELYEQVVTSGLEAAKQTVDRKSEQLEQILRDPEGTLGLFKGLKHFDSIRSVSRVADG